MSRRLETSAEILKLSRLLGVDSSEVSYLEDIPATELRELREKVTESLFSDSAQSFQRVAAGARMIPSPIVAAIAQKAFGPLLCARAAAAVDPAKAIDVAGRLPADFLADTTVELDPRRVASIIARVPEKLVVPVAAELGRRGEYVTMGRFLAFVPDHAIVAAMGALSDEAMLRTAFVLEHKDRLDHAVGLLPPERLPGVMSHASRLGLWPEALDLLEHLSDERRGPVADVLAEQENDIITSLVSAVCEAGIWESLLPVVRTMSDGPRRLLAANPAFHDEDVLRQILNASAATGLWADLVPLLHALPSHVVATLPPLVAELDPQVLTDIITEAATSPDLLVHLVDILAGMEETGRRRVIDVIEATDDTLAGSLVSAVTDPQQVRPFIDRIPADVMQAIERTADRLGLRAELDAALADASQLRRPS